MTPGKRPIIGVTGPDRGGGAAWAFTRVAVWLAGGHAVRITPRRPRKSLDGLDGLIIGGGADVDPTLYGQELLHVTEKKKRDEPVGLWIIGLILFPLTWLMRKLSAAAVTTGQNIARDELEMKLIDDAVHRRLPVLGICRGEQLLNVYFGGSLHQGLAGLYVEDPEVRTILPRKRIVVEPDSCLARVLGRRPVRVNALHRQAIDRLGRGMRVSARDRNGIVQAIEHNSLPLLVGVQWHPEYLLQMRQQRALFEAIVRQAKETARAADTPGAARPPPPPRCGHNPLATAAAVVAVTLMLMMPGCADGPQLQPIDVGPTTGSRDNHEIGGVVFDTPLEWSDFQHDRSDGSFAWRKRDPATGQVLIERKVRQPFSGVRLFFTAKQRVNAELRREAGVTGWVDWTDRRAAGLHYAYTPLLRLNGGGGRVGRFVIVRGIESRTLWLHSLVMTNTTDTTEPDARALAADMLAALRGELADGTNPPRVLNAD
jgi:putative glutamine amidotransferase